MNIGTIIMEKRKEKQVTQQELANFVGVSKASVSKWETGKPIQILRYYHY